MNRSKYFESIEQRLNFLAFRLELLGGLNILNLHIHSENFYLHFFNLLFGWKLQNLNTVNQNAEGVDLVDVENKLIVQVSATATRQKVEAALNKDLSKYDGFSFKFISISKDAAALRTKTFSNPHSLTFSPADDIFDIRSLLKIIEVMEIGRQKAIYEFLEKELKIEPDAEKVESILTTIIKILSKEDWNQPPDSLETIPYDIPAKITENELDKAAVLIDDYKVHYPRIDKIYTEFDRQGSNRSQSILNGIRSEYLALDAVGTSDERFFSIIKKVVEKIRASANYTPISDEELNMCVEILVVDTFIRCKIFKNPSLGSTNADS